MLARVLPAVRRSGGDARMQYSKVLDLFPEAPAPEPVAKRRGRKPVPRVSQTEPRDGASVAGGDLPVAQISATGAGEGGAASGIQGADIETLAQCVAAHPDFRVQRRLQPRLDWPRLEGRGKVTVLVLDTETTGLDATREHIIELALLRVEVDPDSGTPMGRVAVYDGLEDPGKPIPPEVVALTGIRDADVKGQTLDESLVAQMLDGVDLVVAHNAAFDRPFVERRFPRFAGLAWACSFADIEWKKLGRSSAKLESLAQAQGYFYDAHRAEMDCHALLSVLCEPFPGGTGGGQQNGLQRLIASAAEPAFTLQALHAPFDEKDRLKARGYRWNAEQRVWQARLRGAAALQAECEWLRAHVYGARPATVQIETQDALVKYAQRPGLVRQQPI